MKCWGYMYTFFMCVVQYHIQSTPSLCFLHNLPSPLPLCPFIFSTSSLLLSSTYFLHSLPSLFLPPLPPSISPSTPSLIPHSSLFNPFTPSLPSSFLHLSLYSLPHPSLISPSSLPHLSLISSFSQGSDQCLLGDNKGGPLAL